MRLLVVEDNPDFAALLRAVLGRAGFAVDVAGSAADALVDAAARDYGAIVLDLGLPDGDGLEVCRSLRTRGDWRPILMLTGRGDADERVRGLEAGADDYLVKPCHAPELVARVRALVRRGRPFRPAVLEVGDLRLDPATRAAWRGDVSLALSAKEFMLLQAFMRHPGEVLSRDRLLEHGWDHAYENRSNVVDVYVRYLREKIDRPFGVRSLETVRGAGYRLRASSHRPLMRAA